MTENVIIITHDPLRQAVGELHATNRVIFYIFVGSWVISVSRPKMSNEINKDPYYVKIVLKNQMMLF